MQPSDEHPPGERPAEPARGTAAGLVARASSTDRAARFGERLAEVAQRRARRRARARLVRWLVAVAVAGVGVLVVVAGAAVAGTGPPGVAPTASGAVVGFVLGAAAPLVRERLAARRGAAAWDWHRERHVLIGDPSVSVRDADRPGAADTGRRPPLG